MRQDVFGNALDIDRTAAVKTGTSENYKDAWTIGYTPSLTIGVWVGNNDNSSMDKVAGSLGAAPIWRDLMQEFSKDMPEETFIPPGGVIAREVCAEGGRRAFRGSNVDTEYFVAGTESTSCRPLDTSRFAFAEIDKFLASIMNKDEDKNDKPEEGQNNQQPTPQPTAQPTSPPIGGIAPPVEANAPQIPQFEPSKDENRGNGNGRGNDKKDD
jgi:membrane peptidoglycan carboxypeptidase